tara:strand:- start:423 stop:836 length:414 start_codon:yes stop_codon:yes gene_type:complete
MINELKNIKSEKSDLKKFANVIGATILLIAVILFFFDKEVYKIFSITGISLIFLGFIFPVFLKPIYLVWMSFAVFMGWVMTRVILGFLFYFIIFPISLVAKLFGTKFLDLGKNLEDKSYWNNRDSAIEKNQNYENQF